jgi:hypothetical protein
MVRIQKIAESENGTFSHEAGFPVSTIGDGTNLKN